MTMTRQHFQLIAEVVNEYINDVINGELDATTLAYKFASKLKNTNSAFNREKFLKACGLQ